MTAAVVKHNGELRRSKMGKVVTPNNLQCTKKQFNKLYVYFIRVYIYSFPGNKSPLLKLLRFARDIFLSLVSAFISPLLSVWRCSHLDSQTATDTSRAHVMLRGRGRHTGSHKTVCHLFLVLTVANWQNQQRKERRACGRNMKTQLKKSSPAP